MRGLEELSGRQWQHALDTVYYHHQTSLASTALQLFQHPAQLYSLVNPYNTLLSIQTAIALLWCSGGVHSLLHSRVKSYSF